MNVVPKNRAERRAMERAAAEQAAHETAIAAAAQEEMAAVVAAEKAASAEMTAAEATAARIEVAFVREMETLHDFAFETGGKFPPSEEILRLRQKELALIVKAAIAAGKRLPAWADEIAMQDFAALEAPATYTPPKTYIPWGDTPGYETPAIASVGNYSLEGEVFYRIGHPLDEGEILLKEWGGVVVTYHPQPASEQAKKALPPDEIPEEVRDTLIKTMQDGLQADLHKEVEHKEFVRKTVSGEFPSDEDSLYL